MLIRAIMAPAAEQPGVSPRCGAGQVTACPARWALCLAPSKIWVPRGRALTPAWWKPQELLITSSLNEYPHTPGAWGHPAACLNILVVAWGLGPGPMSPSWGQPLAPTSSRARGK